MRRAALRLHLARRGAPGRTPADLECVLHSDRAVLEAAGLTSTVIDELLALRDSSGEEAELARAAALGVVWSTAVDPEYPVELIGHPYAPLAVCRHGALPPRPRVGIVGARAPSSAMVSFAERLGEAAGGNGIAVVSGLARGIDAAAHRGALRGSGACIGVLGCGLDVVYPPDTRAVRNAIWDRGAMFSTFPLGSAPLPHHFPLRNRLLAALCDAVVVVQARRDSGSMSTARAALDAGIEVLVVPGSPDDPLAEGTNSLLKDGARPVLSPRDLVEAMIGVGRGEFAEESTDASFPADPLATAIRAEIGSLSRDADSIARAIGRETREVIARLTELELDGRVFREPGGVFRLRKPRAAAERELPSIPLQSGDVRPDHK